MKEKRKATKEEREAMTYAFERTCMVITYKPGAEGEKGVPIGHGTGFFFQADGRSYVVTNTHVLEAYCALREKGAVVQVSVEEGMPGLERHSGYLLVPQKERESDGVLSKYDFKDIGLIELTEESAHIVSKNKKFIVPSEVDATAVPKEHRVFYRGYPKDNVEFHGPIKAALGVGYTLFTRILDSSADNIVLEQHEGVVISDDGACDDARDLEGISGSALLDGARKLRGIVWGGVTGKTYACPSATLLTCIERYVAKRKEKGQ